MRGKFELSTTPHYPLFNLITCYILKIQSHIRHANRALVFIKNAIVQSPLTHHQFPSLHTYIYIYNVFTNTRTLTHRRTQKLRKVQKPHVLLPPNPLSEKVNRSYDARSQEVRALHASPFRALAHRERQSIMCALTGYVYRAPRAPVSDLWLRPSLSFTRVCRVGRVNVPGSFVCEA